ncbi:aldose 1-epimerase family protein [Treponema sp.]
MTKLPKQELLKRVGTLAQVAGVRDLEFASGKAKGTRALEMYNLAGLRCTVLPDKCMDIADLSYRGMNLSFSSKNGITANKFFNALDNEFLYNWSAGLLSTCGLANTGPSCEDGGLYRTEHGRLSSLPAENVSIRESWMGDDCRIELGGRMQESYISGSNLALKREISLGIYDRSLVIEDTVENLEPSPEEFMLLYHINFGYPLINAGSEVLRSAAKTFPQTEMTEAELGAWNKIGAPQDDCPEQVFYHVNKSASALARAAIFNRELGFGVSITYSADTLPILVHWKSMRSHDYTVALEPSNTYIMGRKAERENGTLPTLAGYGSARFRIEIGILEGDKEMDAFKKLLA